MSASDAGGAGRRRWRDPSAESGRRPIGLSWLLQRSILVGAAIAMLLFGAPLAVAVNPLYQSEAVSELARDAERALASLTASSHGDDLRGMVLPQPRSRDVVLGVYAPTGRLLLGRGPATPEDLVRTVGQSRIEQEEVIGGQIVVAIPVSDDARTAYVVRASVPYSKVRARTYATWAVMIGLAVLVLAVVAAVGRSRAQRLARPLQTLADAADALGHGDFSVRAVQSGVTEVDEVSDNLERTARRIGGMLERERSFSADASHQLRTPMTAVRIGLEAALLTPGADLAAAVDDALVGLDRLEQTVSDLLALARDTTGPRESANVATLAAEAGRHWGRVLGEYQRTLRLALEADLPRARVSKPALRTVLDVLLANALTHGDGEVTIRARATESIVVVEVEDQGPGVTGDPRGIFARRSAEARGTGIGLALARSLVEADGGRLELTRATPATFALLLPVAGDADSDPDTGRLPRLEADEAAPPPDQLAEPAAGAAPAADQAPEPGRTRTAGS